MELNLPKSNPKQPMTYFEMINEAWGLSLEFQKSFWSAYCIVWGLTIALLFLALIMGILTNFCVLALLDNTQQHTYSNSSMIYTPTALWIGIVLPFIMSLRAGLWMMCLKCATNQPYDIKMIFQYFNTKFKLFISCVFILGLIALSSVFIYIIPDFFKGYYAPIGLVSDVIGIFLFIYFSFCYSFTTLLLVDRKLSILDALEMSRQKFTSNILLMLGLGNERPKTNTTTIPNIFYMYFSIKNRLRWVPFNFLSTCVQYREYFDAATP